VPVPHVQIGAGVVCDVCGRKVYLTAPPPEGFATPVAGLHDGEGHAALVRRAQGAAGLNMRST